MAKKYTARYCSLYGERCRGWWRRRKYLWLMDVAHTHDDPQTWQALNFHIKARTYQQACRLAIEAYYKARPWALDLFTEPAYASGYPFA